MYPWLAEANEVHWLERVKVISSKSDPINDARGVHSSWGLRFAPCLQHTPLFIAWFLHPLVLHRLKSAPCLLHTPPLTTWFVHPSAEHFFLWLFFGALFEVSLYSAASGDFRFLPAYAGLPAEVDEFWVEVVSLHVVAFAVLLDLFDFVVLTERRRAAALKREIFLIDFMILDGGVRY